MSGSRLGRGRAGRLALLGCATIIVIVLMYVYRSTSAEMAKLKDLHVKCAQQQEALAAQLQVIYEYKVQLEKTLSNEKSANAAAKEELQQKASRERSLRDKDSLEATQRFNALQQNYKILQTEHQDLKDDCKKKEDVALDNSKRLEATLLELRQQQKKAAEEKEKSVEEIKNKYLAVLQEKEQLEEKYNDLKKATGENSGNLEHLQKQVIQLQRELEEAKKTSHFSVGALKTDDSLLPRPGNEANLNNANNDNKPSENNSMQIRPSSQHQVSVSVSNPGKLAAAAPPASQNRVLESSSKPSTTSDKPPVGVVPANKRVKLPQGVLPIPRLPGLGQAPAPEFAAQPLGGPANGEVEEELEQQQQQPNNARHAGGGGGGGEQGLDRRESDGWYKLKAGVQEIGDPHHLEKFDNAGANEDVEQYDDYNYKEPQNKNGDLHLEEGEDEREDEDDYMHNNVNVVKH